MLESLRISLFAKDRGGKGVDNNREIRVQADPPPHPERSVLRNVCSLLQPRLERTDKPSGCRRFLKAYERKIWIVPEAHGRAHVYVQVSQKNFDRLAEKLPVTEHGDQEAVRKHRRRKHYMWVGLGVTGAVIGTGLLAGAAYYVLQRQQKAFEEEKRVLAFAKQLKAIAPFVPDPNFWKRQSTQVQHTRAMQIQVPVYSTSLENLKTRYSIGDSGSVDSSVGEV